MVIKVATGFTEKEIADIRSKLKEAARKSAASIGARKTTVDELCMHAGISKGAFYKFYDSKEALFFEILEDWHTIVYGKAREIMSERSLSDNERVYRALSYACNALQDASLLDFYECDTPLILRKMPQDVLDAHYHSDETHIAELIEASGIRLKCSADVAAAMVRALILTLTHQAQIGPLYPQVMDLMIRGVCDQLTE